VQIDIFVESNLFQAECILRVVDGIAIEHVVNWHSHIRRGHGRAADMHRSLFTFNNADYIA